MKLSKKLFGSYRYTFTSPEGQTVLKDLESVSGIKDFTETKDPIEMAYMAGKKDFYLYVETMVNEAQGG